MQPTGQSARLIVAAGMGLAGRLHAFWLVGLVSATLFGHEREAREAAGTGVTLRRGVSSESQGPLVGGDGAVQGQANSQAKRPGSVLALFVVLATGWANPGLAQ